MTDPQANPAPEALSAVDGDLLPAIGEKVLIHLNSSDSWVEHRVVGYYVRDDQGRNTGFHRVFVRVVDSNDYLNARLLQDVRRIGADASPLVEANDSPCVNERGFTLPERDPSKPAEAQGMFRKFNVSRVDGSDAPGGKHSGCEYFVLDLDHDVHAPAALRAYAQACKDTHPTLSAELKAKFGSPPKAPALAQEPLDVLREVVSQYKQMNEWRMRHQCENPEPGAEQAESLHRTSLALAMAQAEKFIGAHPAPSAAPQSSESAEEYLRSRYGAYRGHYAWRDLEEAFNAGRQAPSVAKEPVGSIVRCHSSTGKRIALFSKYQNLPIETDLYAYPVLQVESSVVARAMEHPTVLEIMAGCAEIIETEGSAVMGPEFDGAALKAQAKHLREQAEQVRKSDPDIWCDCPVAGMNPPAVAVQVTDGMAYSFNRAIGDSPLSADDVEQIKVGLRAALADVPATAAQQVDDLIGYIHKDDLEQLRSSAAGNHLTVGLDTRQAWPIGLNESKPYDWLVPVYARPSPSAQKAVMAAKVESIVKHAFKFYEDSEIQERLIHQITKAFKDVPVAGVSETAGGEGV